LSSLVALTAEVVCADWESVFFDRLRLEIVEADADDKINIPRPSSGAAKSKKEFLQDILTNDEALLASINDFSAAVKQHRNDQRDAIRLLHILRSHLLNQASDDAEEAPLEPRRTSLGGLAFYVVSGKSTRSLVSGVTVAMKKATLDGIKLALEEIKSRQWTARDTFQAHLDAYLSKIAAEIPEDGEENTHISAEVRENERIEVIRKRLLREDSEAELIRSIAEWCGTMIQYV
jgi:hypothetical protein